jgi:beta-lactamase class A
MKVTPLIVHKSLVYNLVIGIGLLAPLMGDVVRSSPESAVAAAPKQGMIQINPDDWQSMASAVRRQAHQFTGTSGYVIKDLRSGHVVSAGEDTVFPSASLIKLPILCAAFQAVHEGKLSLSTPYTLIRADRHGGSGVLKMAPLGTVYTNRELLELMIVNSDNTATAIMVRQLGIDYLQQAFVKLGLQDTEIHEDGFRLTPHRVADDNMTSPRDMALLLEKIYQRQLVSADASDQMLDILKHQHLRDRLPRFLPIGWQIAHKTGLLRKACHDVGIVFTPQGDYMICVLTAHDQTYKMAKRFIASMGRITFDCYQGGVHHPMVQTRLPEPPVRTSNSSPRSS